MTKQIEARLRISAVDKTGAVLGNVSKRIETLSRRMDRLNKSQQMIGNTFALLSRFVAPAALLYGVKQAVTQFAEVERRMTRIGVTADASREQTIAATEKLRELAMQTGLTFDEAAGGLETLVSSGQSLDEAMQFLPAVLRAAQATGASTADMANSALKAASALKINARQLDRAFDIMVAGGKAGQFEMRDMAQYIPGLANSFASLGYKGEEGLKMLVAILQTIREDTGSAEQAATQAGEVFGKIFAPATINAFKKFNINLMGEMKKSMASGQDAVTAFVEITKKAINGDLKKLPQLFADKEFRAGMTSLLTSPEALQKFISILNDSKVEGTVLRDVGRMLEDTQAKITNLSTAWSAMVQQVGAGASEVLVPVMERITQHYSDADALGRGTEMLGSDPALRKNTEDEFQRRVRQGGYIDPNSPQGPERALNAAKMALGRGEIKNLMEWIDREVGRIKQSQYGLYQPGKMRPVLGGGATTFNVDDENPIVPAPAFRPTPQEVKDAILMSRHAEAGDYHGSVGPAVKRNRIARPYEATQLAETYQSQMDEFRRQEMAAFETGGQQLSTGGDEAGRALVEAGRRAGDQFAQIVAAAGAQLGRALANIKVNVNASATQSKANANLGENNTFALDRSNRRSE